MRRSEGAAGGSADMESARAALRRYYGYDAFRPGQETLISALLSGRDALGIMPTGAGKSLCYQIPGIVEPGLALVISPLVSLMGDQVRALIDAGVRGSYLNSTLTPGQQRTVMRRAEEGTYKIMYVAPERLADPAFRAFASRVRIPLVAVDEAHCVSQWGQDFRPSYQGIREFVESLPQRPPMIALTATATPKVRRDISAMLGLRDPECVVTGYDRPNLRFSVEKLEPKRKRARVAGFIAEHPGDSGIVYCSTRKDVDALAAWLAGQGLPVARYHAGMTAEERGEAQRRFIDDDAPIMVATNAFGMGIDKSNVRWVLHYSMPKSLEAYYQEAGRAGRDGEPGECLLLWCDGDVATCRYFIERGGDAAAELAPEEAARVHAAQYRMLEAMVGYCHTTNCLRAYILSYFGDETPIAAASSAVSKDADGHGDAAFGEGSIAAEGREREGAADADVRPASPRGCGNCSNCLGEFDSVDVTDVARRCVECVRELEAGFSRSFGKAFIVDIVRGSKAARVTEGGFDRLASYGTVQAGVSQAKETIELLAAEGLLRVSEGAYPTVSLGPRADEADAEGFSFSMKRMRAPKKRGGSAGAGGAAARSGAFGSSGSGGGRDGSAAFGATGDEALFERLRALRKRLASANHVAPYMVFSDRALRDMSEKRPKDAFDFLEVNGVGVNKLERYGEAFLEEIAAFAEEERAAKG